MENILEYKGYLTRIEYSAEDRVLHGKIEGINDLVTFESENAGDIEEEFHLAVDDYIEFCTRNGLQPDKTYSGTFNVRVNPMLHKGISEYAFKHGITMNKAVEIAMNSFLEKPEQEAYRVEDIAKLLSFTTAISSVSNTAPHWKGGVAYA